MHIGFLHSDVQPISSRPFFFRSSSPYSHLFLFYFLFSKQSIQRSFIYELVVFGFLVSKSRLTFYWLFFLENQTDWFRDQFFFLFFYVFKTRKRAGKLTRAGFCQTILSTAE